MDDDVSLTLDYSMSDSFDIQTFSDLSLFLYGKLSRKPCFASGVI